MKLNRIFLRPIAFAARLHAERQLKAFLSAHRKTAEVQQRLLRQLIDEHIQTAFAADHRFASIKTYDNFTSAVPVGNYETLRPYMERVLNGQTTALLPPGQPVLMFSQTSGTTGSPKRIPVTPAFLAAMRCGWNVWGLSALMDHKEAWLRPIAQISSSTRESVSPRGLPCGAISGLLADTQKPIVRRMYVVPPAVNEIADPTAKYYMTLRCSIGTDVSFITTANPSNTIKLIETGQTHAERLIRDVADGTVNPPSQWDEGSIHLRFRPDPALARRLEQGIARDGALLPRHFWDIAFLANWTGGTLKLYLRRLRELFGDVPIRDIGLLASEGHLSVPMDDGSPAGAAEIMGNFLEFMPADERDSPSPRTVLAHQAEVGAEYFLVITNWAGLWRYNIDDRVRVTGRLGQSPVFEFLCRGTHTANITGEKITEHQVVEAMRRACAALSAAPERFVLQGIFAATPYYQLRMEPIAGLDASALAAAMDGALANLNIEYASKRKTGRLGPIAPIILPSGELEKAEAEKILKRQGRNEQYKHKYLMTDVISQT